MCFFVFTFFLNPTNFLVYACTCCTSGTCECANGETWSFGTDTCYGAGSCVDRRAAIFERCNREF